MLSKLKRFRRPRKSHANISTKANISGAKLEQLLYSFCRVTQLNGFHYLRKGKTAGKLNIFWALVPFVMFVFGCVLICLLAQTYYDNPAMIVQLNTRFTSQNPFPAVSVCSNGPLIMSKISNFVDET